MPQVLSIIHQPAFGGPHNRNTRLIPLLERYGFHTTVLLPDEPGDAAERMTASGIDVITMPLHRFRNTKDVRTHVGHALGFWPEIQEIRELIRERGFDLVQINGVM